MKKTRNQMTNNYYVYSHIDINTGKCFYIGIGKNDRVFDGGSKRNKKWREYVWSNGGFGFIILVNNISKETALKIERRIISEVGLNNLCNVVGEDGNSTAFKKGMTPWNKGLLNAQAPSTKKVIYENVEYESVNALVKHLGIGQTTFYRKKKKGVIKINYV